jgi:hypothetical protein
MKFPIFALLLTALLFIVTSAEPAAVIANSTAHSQTRCGSDTSALPHPFLHLRVRGDAMVLEIGFRPANARTTPARQPVTLRLTLAQSGRAEFLLCARNLRLVFPRRTA